MRIALLTNYIPLHRLPLFSVLTARLEELKVFLSTPMEPHRTWAPNWKGLDVVLQKNWMLGGTWRHPQGFAEPVYIHIPYDTFPQLLRFKPDLLIANEMGMRTLFAALYARLYRVPFIIWLNVSDHTEQGRGVTRHLLRTWLFRQADAVLVNGQGGARYTRRFGVSEDHLFFAPYTADLDPLRPNPGCSYLFSTRSGPTV